MLSPQVVVDCFPESLQHYREGWAVVAVDVIRATTTAVTAVAAGRRCFPVPTLEEAHRRASMLADPLMVGETAGSTPYGFHETNSPAAVARRADTHRPMVLLSTSGTRLLSGAAQHEAVYAACLRNWTAQAAHLVGRHEKVAVVGAGSRGEFREEDQLCCAWIAGGLVAAGYAPDPRTAEVIDRWAGVSVDAVASGASAAYLRRTGQVQDLAFVLCHVDDLDAVFILDGPELVPASPRGRWPGTTDTGVQAGREEVGR